MTPKDLATAKKERTPVWACGVVLSLALCALCVFRPHLFDLFDYKIYDWFLARAPAARTVDNPVIVSVDEASLERYGQWPWPRRQLAQLLDRLRELGAAAVGLDILFPEAERALSPAELQPAPPGLATTATPPKVRAVSPGDRALARALRAGPFALGHEFAFEQVSRAPRSCVLHPLRVVTVGTPAQETTTLYQATEVICSLPHLAGAVDASGFLNATPDRDGVLRSLPLLIRYGDQLYPSLPLATFLRSQETWQVTVYTSRRGLVALDCGRHRVPLDPRGNLLVRYRGPQSRLPQISARDVLEGGVDPAVFEDKLVFVGATAFGLDESVATPFGSTMSGLEVLAAVGDNLLQGDFLQRPTHARGIELLVVLLLSLGATLLLTHCRTAWSLPALAAIAVALWHASIWSFERHGVFFSPLLPLLALVSVTLGLAFAKYLTEARKVEHRSRDLRDSRHLMMESLTSVAQVGNHKSGIDRQRTRWYTETLARALANRPQHQGHLTGDRIDLYARLAPLRDIGKMGVSDGLLLKRGSLSEAEFAMVKKHTRYGDEALARAETRAGVEANSLLSVARQIVTTHHERWDGSGYPNGLAGEDIPLCGRLVALVDTYEALTTVRSYRPPRSHQEAVDLIREASGSQFDPDVVAAFLEVETTWAEAATEGDTAPARGQ